MAQKAIRGKRLDPDPKSLKYEERLPGAVC